MSIQLPSNRPIAISLILLGAIPPLIPLHYYPLVTFYEEWSAAAIGVCLICYLYLNKPRRDFGINGSLAYATLGLVGAIALQPLLNITNDTAAISWALLYLAFFLAMHWAGAALGGEENLRSTINALGLGIAVAAIANSIAIFSQTYGTPELLRCCILRIPDNVRRPAGNIGQANHFVSLATIAIATLAYWQSQGAVRKRLAIPLALTIIAAIALTGARIAALYFLIIATLSTWKTKSDSNEKTKNLAIASWMAFAGLIATDAALETLGLGAPEGFLRRVYQTTNHNEGESAGINPRLHVWRIAWEIFIAHPILGSGIGSFPFEYFQSGPNNISDGVRLNFGHAHNILLHLMAETGIVGGGAALLAILAWWRSIKRLKPSIEKWWVSVSILVILTHSLVEFPLWYANFLGMTGLIAGLSMRATTPNQAAQAFRIFVAGSAALGLIALTNLFLHRQALQNWIVQPQKELLERGGEAEMHRQVSRLRSGLFGTKTEMVISENFTYDRKELAEKIEIHERLTRHWPGRTTFKHAIFLAIDGRTDQASDLVRKLSITHSQDLPEFRTLLLKIQEDFPKEIKPLQLVVEEEMRKKTKQQS